MSLWQILVLVIILLLLFGGFRDFGPGPFYGTGRVGGVGLGTILIILLLVFLLR